MDRKIATIVGATAALVAAPAVAQAATEAPAVHVAASYAELLEPIANPVQQLKLADAQDAHLQNVQLTFQFGNPHHHHHHSSDWYQSHGYRWYDGRWEPREYYERHHHHHHHSNYYGDRYGDRYDR